MLLNVTCDLCHSCVQGLAGSPKRTSNSLSLFQISFLPPIINFPSKMCTLYSLLNITACDPHPRYIFASWHFREWCSDLEDLCCVHLGNTMLYGNDNKCWLAFCNLKTLMNHFRKHGWSSVYHAVCEVSSLTTAATQLHILITALGHHFLNQDNAFEVSERRRQRWLCYHNQKCKFKVCMLIVKAVAI